MSSLALLVCGLARHACLTDLPHWDFECFFISFSCILFNCSWPRCFTPWYAVVVNHLYCWLLGEQFPPQMQTPFWIIESDGIQKHLFPPKLIQQCASLRGKVPTPKGHFISLKNKKKKHSVYLLSGRELFQFYFIYLFFFTVCSFQNSISFAMFWLAKAWGIRLYIHVRLFCPFHIFSKCMQAARNSCYTFTVGIASQIIEWKGTDAPNRISSAAVLSLQPLACNLLTRAV